MLAFLLVGLGCSSGSSSDGNPPLASGAAPTGPAPAANLACTSESNSNGKQCECTLAATRSGACSPLEIGNSAHCCASLDAAGATTKCVCEQDLSTNCCLKSNGDCECEWANNLSCRTDTGGDKIVDTCAPPPAGHCCARPSGTCDCGVGTCSAGETEVPSCAKGQKILNCAAVAATPVTSCQ